jgi:hypothetical protein
MERLYTCDFLSIAQAVDLCARHDHRISRQAVLCWAQSGLGVKIRGHWFFEQQTVLSILSKRTGKTIGGAA